MEVKSAAAAIAGVLVTALVAGCGLGPGPGTSDVTLTVTRDFGKGPVLSVTRSQVTGSQTVMRLLEGSARVSTRYGGGFVESINGLSGSSERRDWFYYVNGIEAPVGAAQADVHKGDRIWWDLHDWSASESIPAVVGSFPEPFVHGIGGRRLPTVVECAADVSAACGQVSAALQHAGVPVSSQALGSGSGTDSLALLVGTWSDLKRSFAAAVIEKGPGTSGIYARFAGPQDALQLLDPQGSVVRTLHAGAGLIAATAQGSAEPTWLVTGTDADGVEAAADSLTARRLDDHFALAVQGSSLLEVPQDGAK